MLRTPRAKFAASPHAAVFGKLVAEVAFEEATNAAMLELVVDLPRDGSPQQSADSGQQLIGARKYLDLLWTIYQKEADLPKPKEKNLDYAAGV